MKIYRMTGRGKASVAFAHGEALGMNYDLGDRTLQLEMHTRRKGPGGATLGDLQVTATTPAASVEEAMALLTRGREMAMFVSVASNAWIQPIEGELCYEITPGVTDREFFQRFVLEDEVSYADRVVPIPATSAFLKVVSSNAHRNRLVRSISQYSEALRHWEHGNEVLIIAHLFMGVEAIKKACWREEIKKLGIEKLELARDWGFDPSRSQALDQFLDNEARRRLVFKNDDLHHRIAKLVSDSFEHGFENAGDLYKPAASTIVPTAQYLRQAIFDLSRLAKMHQKVLNGRKYKFPRGPSGLEQYFRGVLSAADGVNLSAEGQAHPHCVWNIEIEAKQLEDGRHEYSHKPTMTAVIGKGVTLRPKSQEVWGRGTFRPKSAS